jgi:hypothetical protein
MNETLLYIGSIVIILWGIAHIIPTKAIVNGFGEISEDNRKVLTGDSLGWGPGQDCWYCVSGMCRDASGNGRTYRHDRSQDANNMV